MTGMLDGRVALVTGAASGIGRSSALAVAQSGAKVVVGDVLDGQGRETVDLIEAAGGEAICVHADVKPGSEVEGLVSAAVETFGRLDCARNNAGIESAGPPGAEFHTYSEDAWDLVLNMNLKGVFHCMQPKLLKCSPRAAAQSSTPPRSPASWEGLVRPTAPQSMAS